MSVSSGGMRGDLAMNDDQPAGDSFASIHLTPTRLAAYIDDRLDTTVREEAARHLATCAECRADLRDAQRVRSGAARPRWGLWVPVATSAAAILAFFVVPRMTRQITAPEELRAAPAVAAPVAAPLLQIVSPRDGAHASSTDLKFVWHPIGGRNVTYQFTLADVSGTTIWSAQTSDTAVALPASVTLAQRVDYFWFVDANLANGRSTKTPALRVSMSGSSPSPRRP